MPDKNDRTVSPATENNRQDSNTFTLHSGTFELPQIPLPDTLQGSATPQRLFRAAASDTEPTSVIRSGTFELTEEEPDAKVPPEEPAPLFIRPGSSRAVIDAEKKRLIAEKKKAVPAVSPSSVTLSAGALTAEEFEKSGLAVDVQDVSVMFNLSKNREDGIKEYFINLIKGKIHFDEFWALRNISFQVKKGESLALIGRNGSGKSTILKTIAGIIRPARGTVRVSGNIAPLIEMTGGFDRSLSARENIYLVGTMHGHTKKYIRSRFDEIVEFAEIEKFIDVPLKNYSSGMVSRLGFAIATSVDADIIIADEVLSVGDARFRMKCEKRIAQMLDGGTTLLFVSHNSAQVKKLCKRAVWLEKGKVMDIGPSGDVCDKYIKFIRSMPGKPVKKPAPKPAVEDHTEDDDILS